MNNKLTLRGNIKVKGIMKFSIRFVQCTQIVLNILVTSEAAAALKTSASSGEWNNASIWSPAGKPAINDDVIISENHIITINSDEQLRNLTVSENASFICSTNKTLNLSGDISVNGTVDMNGGDITFVKNGSDFTLGPQSVFKWAPGNNTSTGASLFTKGQEKFNESSTLIIQRWFDYTTPLGEIISGNFGNLVINTPGGSNSIIEWNQKNEFESHLIKGTLTIDQGWVTLDKTGSISSTTIGNIVLSSLNSSFTAHNGSHPSSFTLKTNSITNNGGNFYGLNDGNGNINVIISGNFSNAGNVKIINNSGVSNVSNGNVVLRVDGNFQQTSGDTRLIYNITTKNSGTFSATFKNLTLLGGIFMGQSACHTGGRLNLLNVTQDFTINFNKSTDKFRGNGLTSIGDTKNNSGLAINIGRDLNITGTTQAEFTSSASTGDELVSINGNMTIQGCTSNFNYGTIEASHNSQLFVKGNFSILGGICCLSKNNGTMYSVVSKNLNITDGELILKENTGVSTFIINGAFNQNGGIFVFHSNQNIANNDIIKTQVNGNFNHTGGTINFDKNISGAENVLSITGDSCSFSGNGIITCAGNSSSISRGKINFEKEGLINYKSEGNNYSIDRVIQSIDKKCELVLNNQNIKIASFPTSSIYALRVNNGGKLTLNKSTISSNLLFSNSSVFIDSLAILSIRNEKGLFGKSGSAFNSNINFSLHKESTVAYCGDKSQIITGISSLNNQQDKKYGILQITMENPKYSAILDNGVFIRTRIELVSGKLNLNNQTLTIENGNKDAVKRMKGFIDCDLDPSSSKNIVNWKNISTGIHEFPFGRSSTNYLPIYFNLLTGSGNEVSISTCRTDKNLVPYPLGTGLKTSDLFITENKVVDRWWSVYAPGTKSDITFTYSQDENLIINKNKKVSLSVLVWTGSQWENFIPAEKNNNKFNNTISLRNVINGEQFVIVSPTMTQKFELKIFEAKQSEVEVLLSWETINEAASTTYKVEKSTDGINFYEIGELENNFNSESFSSYNFSDNQLPEEISYYRLKYINNNKLSYSEVKIVTTNDNYKAGSVKINSVSPNPFSSALLINYKAIDKSAILNIIDTEGRILMNVPMISADQKNGTAHLNLESLKKGVYFLTIINNGKKDTVKIIKNE